MGGRAPTPEKLYQQRIVRDLLLPFGYLGIHVYPLRDERGVFRTPTTAPGWPDLVFLRTPRILAIEVKDHGQKPPPHQRAWLTLFASIPCARAWLVRPDDPPWLTLSEWIRHPAEAPSPYGFETVDDPEAVLVAHKRRRKGRRKEPAT